MIVVFLISIIITPSVIAEEGIKVQLNGELLSFDVPPQLINNRTMVPMRKIFEALGATVEWHGDTQRIVATKEDTVIQLEIGSTIMIKNGEGITLDVPSQIVDSRTLVPVRAVAESFEAEVTWDQDTQTVIIVKEDKTGENPNTEVVSDIGPEQANPKKFLDFSGDTTGQLLKIHSNARYLFEQQRLPEYFFENKSTVAEYINEEDISNINKIIVDVWDKAANNIIVQELSNSDTVYVVESAEQFLSLINEKREEFMLNADKVFDVSFEKIDDNTNGIIIDLAELDEMLISTYIGIVYNEDIGIRYFTLEKSLDDNFMFCEIFEDSRGSYYLLENDKESFINAIKEVLETNQNVSVRLIRQ